MKDCEICKEFKWEKEKAKFSSKVFDVPKCKLKNITIETPNLAENCNEFK